MTYSPTREQKQILRRLEACFRRMGYKGKMIVRDHSFADFVQGRDYAPNRIPLATFAQIPQSYRNACFGVAFSNGEHGIPLVEKYRALGAPQILEVNERDIKRWTIRAVGDPKLIGTIKATEIERFCDSHKEDWSPARVLAAKTSDVQLDFVDIGLLPALEGDVRRKLDQLLKDAICEAKEVYKSKYPRKEIPSEQLFRLVFRLIAAKVFKDRQYEGEWDFSNPSELLEAIQKHYGLKEQISEPVLSDPDVQSALAERIQSTIHFQNLSVESLAFIYEETLVTPKTRKKYGIHSTPPEIAEYIVRQLPFESLAENERRVLEPCSGNGVFLVAAMRRLKELLPSRMTVEERHNYFYEMLCGIELDPFAREVSRLCLTLADYPNPNGWNLIEEDIFAGKSLERELSRSSIVLCNPPFEKFNKEQKEKYYPLSSFYKPSAILKRIIAPGLCPRLLGFVLPYPSFIHGSSYREIRKLLASNFNKVETVVLPDKVFRHSDTESVLLLCSKEENIPKSVVHVISKQVEEQEIDDFLSRGQVSYGTEHQEETDIASKDIQLWRPPLSRLWDYLQGYPKLGSEVEIHRGIEFTESLKKKRNDLVSSAPRRGFKSGLDKVHGNIEPFLTISHVYLNVQPGLMRIDAHLLPWHEPKVIVNFAPVSRGPWRLVAVPDRDGLVCYTRLYGVWPSGKMPIEVVAAILNGPLANAFIRTHGGKRDIRAYTLDAIPIPYFEESSIKEVVSSVSEYIETRKSWQSSLLVSEEAEKSCLQLLRRIDALVLKAYDLPPRYERELLDFFRGHERPGPVKFKEYIPEEFTAWIPLWQYDAEDFAEAEAGKTLARMPVIEDKAIAEMIEDLD